MKRLVVIAGMCVLCATWSTAFAQMGSGESLTPSPGYGDDMEDEGLGGEAGDAPAEDMDTGRDDIGGGSMGGATGSGGSGSGAGGAGGHIGGESGSGGTGGTGSGGGAGAP